MAPVVPLGKLKKQNTPKEPISAETENDKYDRCSFVVEIIEDAFDQSIKPNSLRTSIYRVPDLLRKLNEEAYTPQAVSIGPFHYGSLKLQSMEDVKLRCLQNFMKRANTNLMDLVSSIIDMEQSIRECYEGTIEIDSDNFMKMMLMDACFIIIFLLGPDYWSSSPGDSDITFKPWMFTRIRLDLIMLENQLPLFIIKKLYELLVSLENQSSSESYPSSFLELAFRSFEPINPQGKHPDDPDLKEIMHILDLLRYFDLPPPQRLSDRSEEAVLEKMYSASQLAEAGLKFRVSSSKCPLELKYDNGVLEIPGFKLNKFMMIYARNVMAFEQCHYVFEEYVTDYFKMLDFLMCTSKDVEVLVDQRIIKNDPTTNIRNTLPSNLCTDITYWSTSKDYYDLATQLVDFRRRHWYGILKTTLRRDYFRTPWMGAATGGAIILLILTLIQTVCTVISILKI